MEVERRRGLPLSDFNLRMNQTADNAADTTTTTTLSDTYDDANDAASFQNAATRRNITVAYWTVILLCIPYWWFSTTIERHELPLSAVSAWDDDKDVRPYTELMC